MLTSIILVPFLAALVILFTPRNYRVVFRGVALLATLVSLLLAARMFLGYEAAEAGLGSYKFVEKAAWVPSLGISYFVGVDGINVGLIFMGAIVAFAAACVSWEIKTNDKLYYLLLMVMTGGILGAFASLDLFFFYAFHEFALIPTFIMIGVWGRGENKNYATFNITLYLSAGALIALAGLIGLYLQVPPAQRTFDIVALTDYFKANPMSANAQHVIFPLLMFGFGILVSLWPFHTWAPLGYGAAPAATAMLHAGVLKKFGLYALIRIALPLLPEGARSPVISQGALSHFPFSWLPVGIQDYLASIGWLDMLALLCLGNILYCGWVAMRQRDLNQLIGNSSVAHVGFAFLGIASLNLIGVTGAVVVMIAHGLLAALTFGLSGYIRTQTNTLNMDEMSGLLRRLPFIGAALVMAMLAGCGLPGFANFVGELSVMFGAWKGSFGHAQWFVVAAAWGGLVIGAIYMLRAVRTVLHGELPDKWNSVEDAALWRKTPFVILLASLIVFGFWPRLLTDKIKPSADAIVKMAASKPETTPAKKVAATSSAAVRP